MAHIPDFLNGLTFLVHSLYFCTNLGNCLFRNNENLNFTLSSDGNWRIECSYSSNAFNVTCLPNGSWSQQISCFSKG